MDESKEKIINEYKKLEEFKNELTEEFKKFETEIINNDITGAFKKARKIHAYTCIYDFLMKCNDLKYLGLTIEYTYDYYIGDDEKIDFSYTSDVEYLLDSTLKEYRRKKYSEKYKKEYENFVNTILSLDKQEIFNNYEKIRFYVSIYSWLETKEYEDTEYFIKEKNISELYHIFEKKNYKPNISSYQDIEEFLKEVNNN